MSCVKAVPAIRRWPTLQLLSSRSIKRKGNVAVAHPENSDCTAHRDVGTATTQDAANPGSGSPRTCRQIRFQTFWAHFKSKFGGSAYA